MLAGPAIEESWPAVARRGGYPVPAVRLDEPTDRETWFQGYIDTYLRRDVPEITAVSRLLDFHRLMQRVVLNIGQLENVVLSDLLVWQGGEPRRPGIFPWRTRDGYEVAGLLLYGGRDVTWVTDTVLAVPWWRVL